MKGIRHAGLRRSALLLVIGALLTVLAACGDSLGDPSGGGAAGPQGAQGVQGSQGPQGLQGAQGPQGVQGPQGSGSASAVYNPATPITTATIVAAEAAACAAGGGIVKLPAQTITITSTLPMCNGVFYEGTGYGVNRQVGATGAFSGTQIVCSSNTFDGMGYNNTDQPGSPPTSSVAFVAKMLVGGGVRDLAFNGCKIGLHIGGYYNAGAISTIIENVGAINCFWGFWLENFQEIVVSNLTVEAVATGTAANPSGAGWLGASSGGVWNFGNSQFRFLLADFVTSYQRGWVFNARGISILNDNQVYQLHTNRTASTIISQTATTNGTTTVTLTSGTTASFPLNMPVFFEGTGSGAPVDRVYFVSSIIDATHLTLADYETDPALPLVAASFTPGSGTLNTYGYPGIEVVGYNANGSNTIQPSSYFGLDLEGSSTVGIVVQSTINQIFELTTTEWGTQFQNFQRAVALRFDSNVTFIGFGVGGNAYSFDGDPTYSTAGIQVEGGVLVNNVGGACKAPAVCGNNVANYADGSMAGAEGAATCVGPGTLNASGCYFSGLSGSPSLETNSNGFVESNDLLGFPTQGVQNGTVLTTYPGSKNTDVFFNGTGTVTLSQIASGSAPGDGIFHFLINPTANTETIVTQGGQNIVNTDGYGSVGTSIVIPPHRSMLLLSASDQQGTAPSDYFWANLSASPTHYSGTTATIGGTLAAAGTCDSGTATVPGAAVGDKVAYGAVTAGAPGDAFYMQANVTAANTVTVKVCATVPGTPTASTYNVTVIH